MLSLSIVKVESVSIVKEGPAITHYIAGRDLFDNVNLPIARFYLLNIAKPVAVDSYIFVFTVPMTDKVYRDQSYQRCVYLVPLDSVVAAAINMKKVEETVAAAVQESVPGTAEEVKSEPAPAVPAKVEEPAQPVAPVAPAAPVTPAPVAPAKAPAAPAKADKAPVENNKSTKVADSKPKYECADCHCAITQKVSEYSSKKYKKPLCMNCQKKQK